MALCNDTALKSLHVESMSLVNIAKIPDLEGHNIWNLLFTWSFSCMWLIVSSFQIRGWKVDFRLEQ